MFCPACQGKLFPNTDIPGSDILDLPAASPGHCQNLCSAHSVCTFFTFVRYSNRFSLMRQSHLLQSHLFTNLKIYTYLYSRFHLNASFFFCLLQWRLQLLPEGQQHWIGSQSKRWINIWTTSTLLLARQQWVLSDVHDSQMIRPTYFEPLSSCRWVLWTLPSGWSTVFSQRQICNEYVIKPNISCFVSIIKRQ